MKDWKTEPNELKSWAMYGYGKSGPFNLAGKIVLSPFFALVLIVLAIGPLFDRLFKKRHV